MTTVKELSQIVSDMAAQMAAQQAQMTQLMCLIQANMTTTVTVEDATTGELQFYDPAPAPAPTPTADVPTDALARARAKLVKRGVLAKRDAAWAAWLESKQNRLMHVRSLVSTDAQGRITSMAKLVPDMDMARTKCVAVDADSLAKFTGAVAALRDGKAAVAIVKLNHELADPDKPHKFASKREHFTQAGLTVGQFLGRVGDADDQFAGVSVWDGNISGKPVIITCDHEVVIIAPDGRS